MIGTPKISIIIPIYNKEKYLRYCMESVLLQNLQEIEVICVNAGSTDESFEIISELAWTDERIRIIEQKHKGVNEARYAGVKAAHGEYLSFIDPEDRYYNFKALEILYDKAKENGAKICGGCVAKHTDDSEEKEISIEGEEKYVFHKNRFYSFNEYQYDRGFHRFIFERKLILNLYSSDSFKNSFQESVWFVKALHKAERFFGVVEKVYSYCNKSRRYIINKKELYDILSGITEVSKIAVKNGYDRLLEIEKMRLIRDYGESIYPYICDNDKGMKRTISYYEKVSGFKNLEKEILSFIIKERDSKLTCRSEELEKLRKKIEECQIENNALKSRLDSDQTTLELLNENMSAVLKELSIRGKTSRKRPSGNIIPYPYVDSSHEKDGIKWTDLGDGRIEANGRAEQDTKFRLTPILAKTNFKTNLKRYAVSVGAEDVSSFTWYLAGGVGNKKDGDHSRESFGNLLINGTDSFAKYYEIDTSWFDYFSGIAIVVKKGRTLDHVIFDPSMIPID